VADYVRGLSDVICNADALNGPRSPVCVHGRHKA
jgi:hypothetical protein